MTLRPGKDSASDLPYPDSMEGEDSEAPGFPTVVAKNTATLMKLKGWNQSELGRRSTVSQRHISDLLRGYSDCTTEVIVQLAGAFGIAPWVLMIEDLPAEVLESQRLRILVETYIQNPAGRKLIEGAVDMVSGAPHNESPFNNPSSLQEGLQKRR